MSDPKTLFLAWMGEWRDEAVQRNTPNRFAYMKALRTLKKHQGDVNNAESLLPLEGFGPAFVARLSKRLSKYYKEQNIDPPKTQKAPKALAPPTGLPVAQVVSVTEKKKKTTTREYVPKRRSGAAAILIALFDAAEDGNDFLTKKDLLAEGQKHCDAPFISSDVSNRYTAWSSMSGLIKRELVKKCGNPSRFSLTANGFDLAEKVRDADQELDNSDTGPGDTKSTKHKLPTRIEPKGICSNCEGEFSVLFECDQCKEAMCEACDTFLHQSSRKKAHRRSSKAFAKKRKTVPKPAAKSYRSEERSPSIAAAATTTTTTTATSTSTTTTHQQRWPKTPDTKVQESARAGAAHIFSPVTSKDCLKELVNLQSAESPATRRASFSLNAMRAKPRKQNPPLFSEGPAFLLAPGTFELFVVVDTSEQCGNSKVNKKIQAQLMEMGVKSLVRRLSLGDFAWIAKEKTQPIPGQLALPNARELILDYIIERKRMDDLSSSVMDGRFKEQKFRFHAAGIQHPVYLIEEFGSVVLILKLITQLLDPSFL